MCYQNLIFTHCSPLIPVRVADDLDERNSLSKFCSEKYCATHLIYFDVIPKTLISDLSVHTLFPIIPDGVDDDLDDEEEDGDLEDGKHYKNMPKKYRYFKAVKIENFHLQKF